MQWIWVGVNLNCIDVYAALEINCMHVFANQRNANTYSEHLTYSEDYPS